MTNIHSFRVPESLNLKNKKDVATKPQFILSPSEHHKGSIKSDIKIITHFDYNYNIFARKIIHLIAVSLFLLRDEPAPIKNAQSFPFKTNKNQKQ